MVLRSSIGEQETDRSTEEHIAKEFQTGWPSRGKNPHSRSASLKVYHRKDDFLIHSWARPFVDEALHEMTLCDSPAQCFKMAPDLTGEKWLTLSLLFWRCCGQVISWGQVWPRVREFQFEFGLINFVSDSLVAAYCWGLTTLVFYSDVLCVRYHLVRGSFLPLLSHQAANDYILPLHPPNDLPIAARSTRVNTHWSSIVHASSSQSLFSQHVVRKPTPARRVRDGILTVAKWFSSSTIKNLFQGHRQNYTSSFSSCISRVWYDCRLVLHSPLLICKWFNVSIPIFSPACSSFTSRSHYLPRQTHISSQEMRPLLLVWMLVVPFLTSGAAQDLTPSISWKASATSLIHSSKC